MVQILPKRNLNYPRVCRCMSRRPETDLGGRHLNIASVTNWYYINNRKKGAGHIVIS